MGDFATHVSACSDDILSWIGSKRLELNADQIAIIWYSCFQAATSIRVDCEDIIPSSSVRDLDIYINTDLSMQTNVQRTMAGCFAVMPQIYSFRRSRPLTALKTRVMSLAGYKPARLWQRSIYGHPGRLLSVLKAAAWSVTSCGKLGAHQLLA
jgi:hypothetical protein